MTATFQDNSKHNYCLTKTACSSQSTKEEQSTKQVDPQALERIVSGSIRASKLNFKIVICLILCYYKTIDPSK
jgi:hypothetical protein